VSKVLVKGALSTKSHSAEKLPTIGNGAAVDVEDCGTLRDKVANSREDCDRDVGARAASTSSRSSILYKTPGEGAGTTCCKESSGGSSGADSSPVPMSGYSSNRSLRVSSPMESISDATRRDCPMWWTYETSTMMLIRINTKATTIASPGTNPFRSLRDGAATSRITSIAWAKVATNTPIANWLGRSRRMVRITRGVNCPIANWTTTIVMVSTRPVSVTMDIATVVRMASAASGSPESDRGTTVPTDRSIAMVSNDNPTPTNTQRMG